MSPLLLPVDSLPADENGFNFRYSHIWSGITFGFLALLGIGCWELSTVSTPLHQPRSRELPIVGAGQTGLCNYLVAWMFDFVSLNPGHGIPSARYLRKRGSYCFQV